MQTGVWGSPRCPARPFAHVPPCVEGGPILSKGSAARPATARSAASQTCEGSTAAPPGQQRRILARSAGTLAWACGITERTLSPARRRAPSSATSRFCPRMGPPGPCLRHQLGWPPLCPPWARVQRSLGGAPLGMCGPLSSLPDPRSCKSSRAEAVEGLEARRAFRACGSRPGPRPRHPRSCARPGFAQRRARSPLRSHPHPPRPAPGSGTAPRAGAAGPCARSQIFAFRHFTRS